MSVTLNLKNRTTYDTINVDVEMLSKILDLPEATAGRQLVKLFKNLENTIHDKVWLKMIVNWTPKDGLQLTKIVPWLKLAERVGELDNNDEIAFIISDKQAELIYDRLQDDEFKIINLGLALASFLLDFYAAIGKHPEALTDDLMFDNQ